MPTPTWPATLPQEQFLGLTDRRQDTILRTQMDAGPPSRRQRVTAFTRDVSVPLVLRGSQREDFEAWFEADLLGGAVAFEWTDPRDDSVKTFAFRAMPSWGLTRGGSAGTTSEHERVWKTTLELEIQPA